MVRLTGELTYGFSNAFDMIGNPTGFSSVASTLDGLAMCYKVNSGSTSTENRQINSSANETTANVIAEFAGLATAPTPGIRWRRSMGLLIPRSS
jgi:hypothetical protein